jgi:hypothetical protein
MRYHLRRIDKEIEDKKKLVRVFKETKFITIAMIKDGRPYLVSLSHGYDEEENCLYFHCANEGKKLDYLRATPIIWGQALMDYGYQKGECTHNYVTVMFEGKVKFLEKLAEKKEAFRIMINQLEPDPEPLLEKFLNSDGIKDTIVCKIEIDHATGKKTPEIDL